MEREDIADLRISDQIAKTAFRDTLREALTVHSAEGLAEYATQTAPSTDITPDSINAGLLMGLSAYGGYTSGEQIAGIVNATRGLFRERAKREVDQITSLATGADQRVRRISTKVERVAFRDRLEEALGLYSAADLADYAAHTDPSADITPDSINAGLLMGLSAYGGYTSGEQIAGIVEVTRGLFKEYVEREVDRIKSLATGAGPGEGKAR